MSQTTDKRALCLGITYRLYEAEYDAKQAHDFLRSPGWHGWETTSDGQAVPDSKKWIAARSVIDGKAINPFNTLRAVDDCIPVDTIMESAKWCGAGKLSYLFISCHGFEVKIDRKKVRGLYFGYKNGQGYAYSFDYLNRVLFPFFDVIIIDACFAGGAKHPNQNTVPGNNFVVSGSYNGLQPHTKSFLLDANESKPEWLEDKQTEQKKGQTIIVATRQNKPAFASVLGGAYRMVKYHTDYESLFTHCFFCTSRRFLGGAYGYKNQRKLKTILQETNRLMDGVRLAWKGTTAPNCSFTGSDRYIYEE